MCKEGPVLPKAAMQLDDPKAELASSNTLASIKPRLCGRRTSHHSSSQRQESSYALTDLLRIELCRKRAVAEAAQPL